jgi:hypothetical protein
MINVANEKHIRALSLTQAEELVVMTSGFRANKDLTASLRARSGAEKP